MEAEPLLSLPMGPVRTLGDNRVGWIPNCEDAAPPRCAPVCKATCCAFCAFCAVRYYNSARASGGTCSACYAFCACYLVCTCCTRCARSTRFQNLTCNTVGHKSEPPARNVQMVAKGICTRCGQTAAHNQERSCTCSDFTLHATPCLKHTPSAAAAMNILYHLTPLHRLPTVPDLVIISHIRVILAWLQAYVESADKMHTLLPTP